MTVSARLEEGTVFSRTQRMPLIALGSMTASQPTVRINQEINDERDGWIPS